MKVADPPTRVTGLAGTIAFSDEGEVAACIVAADRVLGISRLTVCDAMLQSFSTFDGFCAQLFDRVVEIADRHEIAGVPIVFADPSLLSQIERFQRWFVTMPVMVPLPGMVLAEPYPPNVETDLGIRLRQVVAYSAREAIWFAPAMASKMRRHPYDALALHRLEPGSTVLPDALSLAVEVLRDPAPRHRPRPRRRPLGAGRVA